MKSYGRFGRSLGSISRIKKTAFQSKIMGNRETKDINIEGRIQLDLLIHMHREHKLSSYSLNNVSYHFLRDQKEDVHHS
jgi:DNA polymerase delta subunit 1